MYCKLIKLINGDNIIVTTDDDCSSFKDKEFLNCVDPVQVGTVRFPKGDMVVETYVLQPWIKMSLDDMVRIPISSIVVAVDLQDSAISQYQIYVEDIQKLNENSEGLNAESFEDDHEVYDDFINAVLGNDNEDDDDDRVRRTDSRTLH
jgi:hypothetical protein